jgi:hypothetical protein
MSRILVLLGLALAATTAFPAAGALDGCQRAADATACPWIAPEYGVVGAYAYTDGGAYAEGSVQQGTGFFGDYLYAIVVVEQQGFLRAHGGLGFADRQYDGIYEDGCACGALQTTFLYLPFGVGWESHGDNTPDRVYYEPQGVLPL